jgi:hypothetical protein
MPLNGSDSPEGRFADGKDVIIKNQMTAAGGTVEYILV